MKRKVYATSRERKADEVKGFWAFPILNASLWIISQMTYSQLPMLFVVTGIAHLQTLVSTLPWLVNGIVLILALVFRPPFAVGYVAFAGLSVTVITLMSVLFVAACFVSVLSAAIIGPLAIALFVVLMLGGLYYLGLAGRGLLREWQSSGEDASETDVKEPN